VKSYCAVFVFLFFLSNFIIAENKMEKKLDLKIPEVNFINKDLKSILKFIKEASIKSDDKGVGITLIHAAEAHNKKEKVKSINFYARDITIRTLIEYVSNQFNLKYKVEEFVVILGETESLISLETKFYTVSKGFSEFMSKVKYNDSGDDKDTKFLKYFKSVGISFPTGAKIKFVQQAKRLVITNTPENHQKIEKYLRLTQ